MEANKKLKDVVNELCNRYLSIINRSIQTSQKVSYNRYYYIN